MFGIGPIIDEKQFGIGFGLIPQTELGARAGSLKGYLLATYAVEPISGAEIPMKLEGLGFSGQLTDLGLGFLQQVIRGFAWQLPLSCLLICARHSSFEALSYGIA